MAIWRRCNKRTCKYPRRCLEHLWFDVTCQGRRFRVPANEFAVPRMEPGKRGQSRRSRKHAIGSGCSSARSKPDGIRVGRAFSASRVRLCRRMSLTSSTRTWSVA